jgi:hypothetical protein
MRSIAKLYVFFGIVVFTGLARGAVEYTGGTISEPSGVAIYDDFDPSLGTLTAVNVSVSGSVMVALSTPVFTPAGNGVASGYPFTFDVQEQFHGATSLVPATDYLLAGEASAGVPETQIPINYDYSFKVDSQTDAMDGLALVSLQATTSGSVIPATYASTTLASFIGPPGVTLQFAFYDLFSGSGGSSDYEPVTFDGITGGASLSIEYDYTAPEPGGIACIVPLLFALTSRSFVRLATNRPAAELV